MIRSQIDFWDTSYIWFYKEESKNAVCCVTKWNCIQKYSNQIIAEIHWEKVNSMCFNNFYVSGKKFQLDITFLDQRFQSQNSSYNYQNETMWPDYYTFSGSQFVSPLYLIRWDNAKRITQLHACCIIAIHDVTQSVIQSQNSSIIAERPCDQIFTHFFYRRQQIPKCLEWS